MAQLSRLTTVKGTGITTVRKEGKDVYILEFIVLELRGATIHKKRGQHAADTVR